MPGLNGTGPCGKGSMTGGGFGRCGQADYGCRHNGQRLHKRRCADKDSSEYMSESNSREEIESLKQHCKELEEKLDALAATVEEFKGEG